MNISVNILVLKHAYKVIVIDNNMLFDKTIYKQIFLIPLIKFTLYNYLHSIYKYDKYFIQANIAARDL